MCYVEYNWVRDCYQFRFNDNFTDWHGIRSLPTLDDWRELLQIYNCVLARTANHTWQVLAG